jgi:hypothetical protein
MASTPLQLYGWSGQGQYLLSFKETVMRAFSERLLYHIKTEKSPKIFIANSLQWVLDKKDIATM